MKLTVKVSCILLSVVLLIVLLCLPIVSVAEAHAGIEASPSPSPTATASPVYIQEPAAPSTVPVDEPEVTEEPEKVIYLSFDDGPCEYTQDVLDLLDKYDAKATFFVIAGRTKYLELLPEISSAGHCLAIHAYKHDYGLLYTSADSYLQDFEKAQQVLYDYTGSCASLVRFPGGSVTANAMLHEDFQVVVQALEEMGISYFDWNVQPEDSKGCNATTTYINFKAGVPRYDVPVVLQHDTRYYSVSSLEQILKWGTDNGYVFKALSNDVPAVHSRLT